MIGYALVIFFFFNDTATTEIYTLSLHDALPISLAIALALADPEIELVACTTLAGNIDVTNATNNTLNVLDYLGASHVPVYRGASRPIARPLFMADYFHGIDGLGESNLPKSNRRAGDYRGPAAMIRYATE